MQLTLIRVLSAKILLLKLKATEKAGLVPAFLWASFELGGVNNGDRA